MLPAPADFDAFGTKKKSLPAIGYSDACNLVAHTKAKVSIVVGLLDTTCTPVGILTTYNQLPGKKDIIILPARAHSGMRENRIQQKDKVYMHEF